MRGKRDPGLERAWRQRVRRQASSGLSVRAFCEQQGLAESAFHFWRQELKRRAAESRDAVISSSPANGQPRFVPVIMAEPSEPNLRDAALISSEASPLAIELVHPGGIVIRVPGRCDVAALRVVLDLLDDRGAETRPC